MGVGTELSPSPFVYLSVSLYLLYFSYALLQHDIHAMASSSCSWCSCIRLPAKCVTWHLCSRCSIVCGCWPQWLQVCVFLFPHLCRVCVVLQWPLLSWFSKNHSPRDSAGFLSPGRGTEGSSMRYALLTTLQNVAIGSSIPQQCRILHLTYSHITQDHHY